MEKKYVWHKVAEEMGEIGFGASGLAEVDILGKKVCLVKKGIEVQACAAKCPHAGGTLAEGYLDAAGNIVCPLHRYKFSPQNGRNCSGEGYFLKTYPVEIRPGGIFIGFEENKFFNWLK